MLCISIKIRKNSNVYRVINYGAGLSTSLKKSSHSYHSWVMIPKTICFKSFKHFNSLHHFTVFQFYSFKTINVRAILMLSDRQLTNAIKVRGINRKSRQLMMDGGENVITVWPAYNGRSKLRPDRTGGVRSDGSPQLSTCNYGVQSQNVKWAAVDKCFRSQGNQ